MISVHIDDLPKLVGQVFVSDWVMIDQPKISAFGDVTNDHNFVHVDSRRAKALRGGTIAHGLLILSLLPGLTYDMYEVTGSAHALNYGLNKVRFTGITPVDTRVRLRVTIASAKLRGEGRLLISNFAFERENETRPACIGESMGLYFPAAPADA